MKDKATEERSDKSTDLLRIIHRAGAGSSKQSRASLIRVFTKLEEPGNTPPCPLEASNWLHPMKDWPATHQRLQWRPSLQSIRGCSGDPASSPSEAGVACYHGREDVASMQPLLLSCLYKLAAPAVLLLM